MSKNKESEMMVLEFGWNIKFVLKTADAIKILEILETADRYDDVWRKDDEGGTTYHVWPSEMSDLPTLKLMGETMYTMAKLSGKPEKK
jgi:hypothetical protein